MARRPGGHPSTGRIQSGHLPRRPDRVPQSTPNKSANSSSADRTRRGLQRASGWARAIRSRSAGVTKPTSSSRARIGGAPTSARDARRRQEEHVNRARSDATIWRGCRRPRSIGAGFLAAAGLTATGAALAACASLRRAPSVAASTAPSASPDGAARPPRRRPGATSRRNSSSTTGATTSPKNIEAFKAEFGLSNFVYDIFSNNEELIAKLQAGASGYDIAGPTAEYVPGMVEEGFLPEARPVADPERGDHQHDVHEPVVGPERTSTRSPRTTAPPASCSASLLPAVPTCWQELLRPGQGRRCRARRSSSIRGAMSSSSRSRCSGYSLNTDVKSELDEARDILLDCRPAHPRRSTRTPTATRWPPARRR